MGRAPLEQRLAELEQRLGRRIVLRPVHDPDIAWRGRLSWRGGWVLVEYQDPEPGYFWDRDLIHELLDCLQAGQRNVCLWHDRSEATLSSDAPPEGHAETP